MLKKGVIQNEWMSKIDNHKNGCYNFEKKLE